MNIIGHENLGIRQLEQFNIQLALPQVAGETFKITCNFVTSA